MPETLLGLGALLLALAAGAAVLGRLGQSAVPAYILLGIGARTAVTNPEAIHFIQSIGITLLLFFVGLEFSILRLRRTARHLVRNGTIDLVCNLPAGVVAGLLLGFEWEASLLLGAALYVSSSAIVAHNISTLRRAGFPDTEVALGVLIAEDLVIAVLLAGVALWLPAATPGANLLVTVTGLGALAATLTWLAPPIVGLLNRASGASDEVLLLVVSGWLLLLAGGSLASGLSEAVGAFAAGLLVGDSVLKERVEHLLAPLHGLFAALFFFAFGLTIELSSIGPVWHVALFLALLAALTKVAGCLWIGRSAGLPVAARLNLGCTLIPRGEFSVLFAAYGSAAGHAELSAALAVVVVVLAIGGTLLTRAGPHLGTRLATLLGRP